MGTSVGMIKAHYGHLDLRNIADKFAGTDTTIDMELKKPQSTDDEEDDSDDGDKVTAKKTKSASKKTVKKTSAKKSTK